jgi:hypothetical protein
MLKNSIIPVRQLHGELRKLERNFPRVLSVAGTTTLALPLLLLTSLDIDS